MTKRKAPFVTADGKPNSQLLLTALGRGDVETAIVLLDDGASPYSNAIIDVLVSGVFYDHTESRHLDAFHMAYNYCQSVNEFNRAVEALLAHGLKANGQIPSKRTYLSLVVIEGWWRKEGTELTDATRMLANGGANVHEDYKRQNLLEHALHQRRAGIAEVLVEHGACLYKGSLRQWADNYYQQNPSADGPFYRHLVDIAKRLCSSTDEVIGVIA